MNTFDLQIQSIASDGAHTTSEIVEMARDAGILTIALTDHDTVAGVAGALEAGRAAGVRVIPGIEMSVEEHDIHILGYGIDHTNSELLAALEAFRKSRIEGAKKMAENLGEKGGLPSLLSAFPPEGKKGNSEKYITRNFLGYTFFNSAYTADYELAGRAFKLFLIEAADKNECKSIIQKYLRQIKVPEREMTEGRYTVLDPHHGVIDLFWKGAYIWGAVDLADADLRSKVLKSFEGNIKPGR